MGTLRRALRTRVVLWIGIPLIIALVGGTTVYLGLEAGARRSVPASALIPAPAALAGSPGPWKLYLSHGDPASSPFRVWQSPSSALTVEVDRRANPLMAKLSYRTFGRLANQQRDMPAGAISFVQQPSGLIADETKVYCARPGPGSDPDRCPSWNAVLRIGQYVLYLAFDSAGLDEATFDQMIRRFDSYAADRLHGS